MGWDKDGLVIEGGRKKDVGGEVMQLWPVFMSREHTKVQSVSKQHLFWLEKLPQFYCWAWRYMVLESLIDLGQVSQPCPLPVSCLPLGLVSVGGRVKEKILVLYDHFDQQLKHWFIINTVLVTYLKRSTIRAAMKEMNFATRPSMCPWTSPNSIMSLFTGYIENTSF